MVRRAVKDFRNDQQGAVAATYALALVGLVVIGGVGFDYGRMMAMDSELQNGADQAALAGATQLNGASGACSRAAAAAIGLVTNNTLLANDSNTITIANETACDATGSIRFWQDRTATVAATSDATAKFIELDVDVRSTRFAFTPLTGLLVGTLKAGAMAGLGSSICKVPPLFMCNPDQANDADFTISNYVGKGIRLVANDGGGQYGAGNFGYLQSDAGSGAQAIADTLGKTSIPGDCVSVDSVYTKPGAQISVLDALNTRFDIYTGNTTNPCGANGAQCAPSANAKKDLVHKGNSNNCGYTTGGGNGWQLAPNPYAPTSAAALDDATAEALSPMGYPRDLCHSFGGTGNCSGGSIGTGTWDRNAYFRSNEANYPGYPTGYDLTTMFGSSTPSRYAVYKYEAANAATRLREQDVGGGVTARPQPYCVTPGVAANSTTVDRRVLSVAVINCGSGLNGSAGPLTPKKWIDVFLVEPAVQRRIGSTTYTEASDVYVEVIGATSLGGGGSTSAQLIRRDVPYLIH